MPTRRWILKSPFKIRKVKNTVNLLYTQPRTYVSSRNRQKKWLGTTEGKKNRLRAVAPTFIIIIISNPDYFMITRLGKGGKGLKSTITITNATKYKENRDMLE